ncbi:MAG: hypothetical protein WCJ04_08580 [Actinomycetes bacterium]
MTDRFVVLGLARSRCQWFSDLASWSSHAVAPIDYIKCLTCDEAQALIGSGRRLSAVLVDTAVPGLDREFIALVASIGAATIIVADAASTRDWESLGCSAILSSTFTPRELVETLTRHAHPVDRSTRRASRADLIPAYNTPMAPLIGVAGSGGTGASTLAISLAQELGRHSSAPSVALADGARRSDMSMYHDVGDVLPGLPELVEAHRVDQLDPAEVRRLLFPIHNRFYHLLLGQRRSRDAAAMRPHSILAAVESLRRSFDFVVIDHDPELDGETETGSIDIEQRNTLSRSTAELADLIVLVGRSGAKGIHDLIRLIDRYADHGVPRERIIPVMNQASRSPAYRIATTRVISELCSSTGTGDSGFVAPLYLPNLRRMEELHRSASPLPEAFGRPLANLTRKLLLELGPRQTEPAEPVRVRPGELGLGSSPERLSRRHSSVTAARSQDPTTTRGATSRRDVA